MLLPAAYYEASILTKKINNPCELGDLDSCRQYKYPPIDEFSPVTQALNKNEEDAIVYADDEHLQLVDSKPFHLINVLQESLTYLIEIPQAGKYIIAVDYITERQFPESYELKVSLLGNYDNTAFVSLPSCLYSTVCRQAVVDEVSKEQLFIFSAPGPKSFEISVSELIYE